MPCSMVEKRSSGWAGRGTDRTDDSTKSFFSHSQGSHVLSQLQNSTPKRRHISYPGDNLRSLAKPGLAVAYIYATVVLMVWQLWPEGHQQIPQPEEVLEQAVAEEQAKDIARAAVADVTETSDVKAEGRPEVKGSTAEVPLPTAAQMTIAQAAIRSQAFIADVTPRLKGGQSVQSLESLRFDSVGRTFEVLGDHLQASWGWLYQGTSGLVGDQRKQEATSGFVPKSLKGLGASIGWQSLFELSFATGDKVSSQECSLVRSAQLSKVEADKWKLIAGEAIELQCPKSLAVQWTGALLRLAGGAEVLRIRVMYSMNKQEKQDADPPPAPVSLTTLDFDGTFACSVGGDCLGTSGEVDGSPLIDPNRGLWIAMEHPRVPELKFASFHFQLFCHFILSFNEFIYGVTSA